MNNDDFESQLKILATMIPKLPVVDIQYRLYYNKDTGEPLFFSMEKLPGEYITVTKKEYDEAAINYIKVENKQLISKDLNNMVKNRLAHSDKGTKTILNDIQFVVDDSYTGAVSIWKLND
jgi:hypothetical protein